MPRKVLRSDAGMTLLELSFAMGILVITMSMLFGALINMQRSSTTVDSRSSSTALMRSVAETIRSMDVQTLATTDFPPLTRNGIEYGITVELEDSAGNLVELPLAAGGEGEGAESIDLDDFPNPIQARITLAWIVLPETNDNGEIVGGRAMQMRTRTFLEGVGPITVPGT